MMNFNEITRYSDYQSYQRLKRIKEQQCERSWRSNKCKKKTYQDYLDKKDGFVCCDRKAKCDYTGILGETVCLAAMLEAVELEPAGVGFNEIPLTSAPSGSLIPPVIWYGAADRQNTPIQVVSLIGPGLIAIWQLQLNGTNAAGAVFKCIELSQEDKTIQLFLNKSNEYEGHTPPFRDQISPGCDPPCATAIFTWSESNVKVSPPGTRLTPGIWIFQISV